MHRSGTSALTRVFSLLGADLPKNILGANPTNEAGHWESLDLMVSHDELLASAGSRWDDWRAFNPDWAWSGVAEGYREKFVDILHNDFAGSRLFVLKDPRICRFVPFWLDVLERFGAEARIVMSVRNPLEVAASLKRRNNFPPAETYLLWLRHVLDAEKATRHLPRAVVTYNDLLIDWRGVVEAVAAKTGLHWPRRSDRSELEIDQFLADALRHHIADDAQLTARADIVDWVKETYRLLHKMAKKPATKDELKRLDRIHAEFDKASASFGLVLVAEAEQSASQLRSVEALIKTRDEEAARLSGELAQLRSAADAAQTASAASLAQLTADLDAARAEAEKRRAELAAALEGEKTATGQANAQAAALQQHAEGLRAVIAEREAAAAKLTADLDAAQAQSNDRNSEIDKLSAALKSGQAALRDRERDVERLSCDIEATRLYLRDSQTEVQRLAGELDGARTEIARASAESQRISHRLQEGHDALSLTATELPAVRGEIAILEAALADLRQETGHRVERISESSTALRLAASQVAQAEAALLAAARDKDELATTLAAYMRASHAAAAAHDARIRELEAALESKTADNARLADEVLRATAEIRRVEKASSDRASALDAVHAAALAESENLAQAQARALRNRLFDAEAALAKAGRERKQVPWAGPFSESRRAARALAKSGLVDASWYLREYPDAAKSGRAPAEHYVEEGYARGYRPNPFFDTRWYLERYEDVRRSGKNPLLHYIQYGAREGRDPGPDFQTLYYLETNPDVRGNGLNPLAHYLRYGRHEGRLPAPRA
jgi:hypothetical protein